MTPREFISAIHDDATDEARSRALEELTSPDGNVKEWVADFAKWARNTLVKVRRPNHLKGFDVDDVIQAAALQFASQTKRTVRTSSVTLSALTRELASYCRGTASDDAVTRIESDIHNVDSEAWDITKSVALPISKMGSPKVSGGSSTPPQLTTREIEILRLIANGRSIKEIAAQLGLTTKTIELHVTRILNKLNDKRIELSTEIGRVEFALCYMHALDATS